MVENNGNNGNLEFTLIEDEPIIGFNICGERRICLPQLLRFVLPDFDIDVIDRAVTDLQINCFQCCTEQVNLLHLNNIVPREVIRCGLIRKSDAERLCKYLLQPNKNLNKIADSIEFGSHQSICVVHTCFGEQRGALYPVLYTSSDAKCIKCLTCDNFFKTFEFVGHTHKLDEVSNTFHWGFDSNNWRLLLQIFGDRECGSINGLNNAKSILDRIKTKFYEEELKKIVAMNKSYANIGWRPSRRLKLPNLPKIAFSSTKPSHLKDGPVEFYKKPTNKGLNNLRSHDTSNSNYVPNVYLTAQDNSTGSESFIDDDDCEEFDDLTEKSLKNSDDIAMSVALQIKREAIPKDLVTLGTISNFLNKRVVNQNAECTTSATNQSTNKALKPNYSPLVVAQANTSIPPQFLMLEALWSQLFHDIIQLTHLVPFNTNEERNRLVGQLIQCQDLFRSQWTNLAEENQDLKEKLAQEQKRRQNMEMIRDQMANSLKELTVEKENLTEIVRQLQSKCEQLQCEVDNNSESGETSICDDDRSQLQSESTPQARVDNQCVSSNRTIFKRTRGSYDDDNNDSNNDVDSTRLGDTVLRKHIRIMIDQYGMESS